MASVESRGGDMPTIVFLSVRRGASTFVARDLASAVCRELPDVRHFCIGVSVLRRGVPIEQLALPPTGVLATRVYPSLYDEVVEAPVPADGRFADKRLVMVQRDPRDVAVSMYWSMAYSHAVPEDDRDAYLARRERLLSLGLGEGIARITAAEAIEEFRATVRFLDRFPETCRAPYELLVRDFPRWLERVRTHVGWPAPLATRIGVGLAERVAPPTREDRLQHKRRVRPGNWREAFDERLRTLFEREVGDALEAAGYTW